MAIHPLIRTTRNLVGDPINRADNVIAYNGGDGIHIDGSVPQVHGNAIHGNSIHSNGGAGIALLANANDNLAAPTIEGVNPLHGSACAMCIVEIYSDRHHAPDQHPASRHTDADGDTDYARQRNTDGDGRRVHRRL